MPELLLEPDDSCLYVTEACNSNCIMCPMSEDLRKRGNHFSTEDWCQAVEHIPDNTEHITITGGEPFLEYKNVIPAMNTINQRFPVTPILILTNGRALAINEIQNELVPVITEHMCFAVPVHSASQEMHDRITRSPGSFAQTLRGLRFLSGTKAKIEIRIVAHKYNLNELSKIIMNLVDSRLRIDVINLIAMEMTGCAAANRKELWVDYREIWPAAENGVVYAIRKGIDVGLYNFPLCSVPKGVWPLCRKSITGWKVQYAEACKVCSEKNACGGMFYSTKELGLFVVQPIEKGDND